MKLSDIPDPKSNPIADWRASLDVDDRAWFDAAIQSDVWQTADLGAVLRANSDFDWDNPTLGYYRRGAKRGGTRLTS